MANKVTIDVEARFVDNLTDEAKAASKSFDDIEKNAEEAGKAVDALGKKKTKPKLDADNSSLLKKLNDSDRKLKKLGRTKTETKLGALDKASAIIAKVTNKAKAFAGKSYGALVKIRDSNALSTLNKISNAGKNIAGKTWQAAVKIKDMATAPLRGIKNMLFSIKSLVLAITAGLAAKQLVMNPINLADAYSSAQIGFSTLLGESRGQQMMNDLDDFAKATPFKSSEVISQTQRMIAMGWDAESIIDDMTTIGDAAAATGKGEQGLQQIVTALAQIKTKGKLSTEELNQLAEAGVSAKKYIAEGLGYGSGDEGIAKMTADLEKGAISSGKALQALLSGMQEYKGMMDKTANETVSGLWSQIEDTFEINIFRRWGQGLQDGAKKSFGSVVELIDKADGALTKFGDTVYEVGKKISNWLADKLEKAVERVTEITGSFEFQEADFGEKVAMLWKGVIADPLKEWFNNLWTDEGNIEKATAFGQKFAENLTKGILAVLGITDIFEDTGDGAESKGSNIAQGFAKGFVEGFDVSAITDKIVDAIGNVWGALPTWAKILIGGYGIGKAAGGISSFAGGIASFAGGVANTVGGFSIASSAFPILTSSGSGILGALGKTGVALGASTTGGAILAGASGIAGGVAGGAAVGKGIYDLYGAHKAYESGDKLEGDAKSVGGITTLGGVGMGASIGAVVGGPLGALLGAGIGGVAGWFMGGKAADDIRAADDAVNDVTAAVEDLETEEEKLAQKNKMVWNNMKDHMGDIKLSASEIVRLADQIVWGADLGNFEKFTSATQQAEASLQSLKTASDQTERWMWKASLGVKFNDDEIESIKESFNQYISSAKSYVENKHYEFTAAVSLLVDVESEEGKSILESGNAFYGKLQEQLNDLGGKLSDKVDIALKDGVITLDEQKEITNLQKQIAAITEKISNAEAKAEIELIKVKFGNGNLDLDSFDSFMSQMETTLNERIAANDEAFKASVATLNLELAEGAITQEEYDKQIQTLVDGYTGKVESIKAEIMNVELEIIAEAYGDEGVTAEKLQSALEKSLAEGIDPIEWTPEQARKFLGLDNLSESSAGAIAKMLGGVADQLELVEVDGKLLLDLGIETKGGSKEEVEDKVKSNLPETVESTVGVDISGEKNIQNTIDILVEDFGVPDSQAATIALLLTGDKELLNKIDVSQLAKEFGIPESQAKTIIEKLTGEKSIENRIDVLASDFGIKDSISKTISVNIKAVKGKITNAIGKLFGGGGDDDGSGYRGGIFGGDSAMDAFARGGRTDNSGIVGGSTRYIRVNEESPEMIIPLSSQRRGRALKLWAQAGNIMGVPGFARGGIIDSAPTEGIRLPNFETDEPARKVDRQTAPADNSNSKILKFPEAIEETITANISGEKNVRNGLNVEGKDFGIQEKQAATIDLLLTGVKQIQNAIDVSHLAGDFGVPGSQEQTINLNLTAAKSIGDKPQVLPRDFGIPENQESAINQKLNAEKNISDKLRVLPGDFGIPEGQESTVGQKLDAEKIIGKSIIVLPGDFGVPETQNSAIKQRIDARKSIGGKLNVAPVDFGIPGDQESTVNQKITAEKDIGSRLNVLPGDFGVPGSQASTIEQKVTAKKDVRNKLHVLPGDFGIPMGQENTVGQKLTAEKIIGNRVSVLPGDFGVPESQTSTIEQKLNARKSVGGHLRVLPGEFGIPGEQESTIGQRLTAEKDIGSRLSVIPGEFGIPENQASAIKQHINAEKVIGGKLGVLPGEFGVPEDQESTIDQKLKARKSIGGKLIVLPGDFGIPGDQESVINQKLAAEKNISDKLQVLSGDFGIPETQDSTIKQRLYAEKDIGSKMQVLGEDFGIPDSLAATIGLQLSAEKSIGNKLRVLASDFGIENAISGTVKADLSAVPGKYTNRTNEWLSGGGEEILDTSRESQRMNRNTTETDQDEGIRYRTFDGNGSTSGTVVKVDMGGINLEINVSGNNGESIVEAIKAQSGELADYMVGIIADALEEQFENTPVRGGAA